MAATQMSIYRELLNSLFLLIFIEEKNQQVRQGMLCIQESVSQELG